MTTRQMNVIYGAVKRNELNADMKDIKNLYGFADMASFEGQPRDREICSYVCSAVSAFFEKNIQKAQEELESAISLMNILYEF